MSTPHNRDALIKWGSAILAALVYGAWAAYANAEHGSFIAARSGLGQGIYAFVSTWLVAMVAFKSVGFSNNRILQIFIAFTLTFLVMLTIPLVIHMVLQTPNVWQAILPGLVWGSGYILVLLWLKTRQPTDRI